MESLLHDIGATGPLTIVSLTALAVLLIEGFAGTRAHVFIAWLAVAGLAAAAVVAAVTLPERGLAFNGMISTGGYGNFFAILFCMAGILSVMLSASYLRKVGITYGEYYALFLLAIAGMMLMSAAADLVVFFLGLEMMSVSFYVLAGFIRNRLVSNEAAIKYFLLGAFATGFLLYGIALVYGSAGSTALETIGRRAPELLGSHIFVAGLALLMIGLAFKVAAVPFHMWVPDVYEGAPTTVTAFMSTGGKAAAFSAFLLIFAPGILKVVLPMREVLAVVALLSMVFGNILALTQPSVKRMLAYSSVAHAGYMLTGVVAGNSFGSQGVLYYLVAYTLMNVGAFGVLSLVEKHDGGNLAFDDYAGFSERKPVLALLMAVFLFSLTGIPPFAGFFGKYYVFAGAVSAGYTWLAIAGVIMSVVSAYYYLRLVVIMYFRSPVGSEAVVVSRTGLVALVISAIGLLGLGILPSVVLSVTQSLF